MPLITEICTKTEALLDARLFGRQVDVSWNDRDGSSLVAYPSGCLVQHGGPDGDGYCYAHQSFDCAW